MFHQPSVDFGFTVGYFQNLGGTICIYPVYVPPSSRSSTWVVVSPLVLFLTSWLCWLGLHSHMRSFEVSLRIHSQLSGAAFRSSFPKLLPLWDLPGTFGSCFGSSCQKAGAFITLLCWHFYAHSCATHQEAHREKKSHGDLGPQLLWLERKFYLLQCFRCLWLLVQPLPQDSLGTKIWRQRGEK